MPREETLDSLKKLGLNEYESKAFKSLSRYGAATPAVLSKDSGIPRARIYDVLDSLQLKGFVVKKPTRPVEYKALGLDVVYKNLSHSRTAEHQQSLIELRSIALSLSSTLELARHERGGVAEDVVMLSGKHPIYSQLLQEAEKAKESVVICSTPDGLKQKQATLSSKRDKLARKGVKVQYKASQTGRYAIFDNKRLLLFLNPASDDPKNERALLLDSPFLATHLGLHFNSLKKP